jgi:redox-sensing transcriptional repressor
MSSSHEALSGAAAPSAAGGVSRKAIYRLSLYLRSLQTLLDNRVESVSSEILASNTGVTPAQVRRDLARFGSFGKRGFGYDVARLHTALSGVLGTNRLHPVILVGAGNLGSALANYEGFKREGFELAAAFDAHPERRAAGPLRVPVLPLDQLPAFISEHAVRIAILAVPGQVAQEVANRLCAAGIRAILNFAPVVLLVPDGVNVNNVNLAAELENLVYFLRD